MCVWGGGGGGGGGGGTRLDNGSGHGMLKMPWQKKTFIVNISR